MSEQELRDEITALRAEVATLRAQLGTADIRLGPKPDTQSDVDARVGRFAESLTKPAIDVPPVDRSKRTLTNGEPVTPDHRELLPNGQQKGYVVLSAEERAKGFVRPVRRTYRHSKCGATTTMGLSLAETYARDPGFYSGTFCATCREHFPLDQFVWEGTTEQVGA